MLIQPLLKPQKLTKAPPVCEGGKEKILRIFIRSRKHSQGVRGANTHGFVCEMSEIEGGQSYRCTSGAAALCRASRMGTKGSWQKGN